MASPKIPQSIILLFRISSTRSGPGGFAVGLLVNRSRAVHSKIALLDEGEIELGYANCHEVATSFPFIALERFMLSAIVALDPFQAMPLKT